MVIYIIYFIAIAVLAIEYEFRPFNKSIPLVLIAVALTVLAGFRAPGVSLDYENYVDMFAMIPHVDDIIYFINFEPGFFAVVWITNFLSNGENLTFFCMLAFAAGSVGLKTKSINTLAINPFLVLLFYYSSYFLLHEMTQIRIGMAAAFFFMSIPYFLKGKKTAFILLVIASTLFHYSAILYLLLLFFNIKKFSRYKSLALLGAAIVFGIIKLPAAAVLERFNFGNSGTKADVYIELGQNGFLPTINFFNALNICIILCLLYLIFMVPQKTMNEDRKLNFLVKTNLFSVFLFGLLSGFPVVGFRISEVFAVTSIFLYAYMAKYLPFKKYNIFFVVVLAAAILYINEFYADLLGPYRMVDIK